MKQRPQLVVPIRDRRERKRYLTTKNVLGVSIAIVAIFATVTIRSEMRKGDKENYGRLFGKQVSGQTELAKPVYDVVKEVPVNDQTASDPMLVASGAREQILIDQTTTNPTTTTVADPAVSIAATTPIGITPGAGVAITGGPEGVTITQGQTKRPTLAGGIFKQQ
jgi:hypothetical protein